MGGIDFDFISFGGGNYWVLGYCFDFIGFDNIVSLLYSITPFSYAFYHYLLVFLLGLWANQEVKNYLGMKVFGYSSCCRMGKIRLNWYWLFIYVVALEADLKGV